MRGHDDWSPLPSSGALKVRVSGSRITAASRSWRRACRRAALNRVADFHAHPSDILSNFRTVFR
jgi:hypothetical protein